MFLNKAKFKKMMKEAYNRGGLKVGRIYDGLVLSSDTWISWTRDGDVPNWLKGAVMELTGENGFIWKYERSDDLSRYQY